MDLPPLEAETLADLLKKLGNISPARIRARPAPGTATVQDVTSIERNENRLYELVEGVLVEKPMGLRESLLAGVLISALRAFVIPRNLGLVTAPDGTLEILTGLVRIPDVAFVSWARLPKGKVPSEPVPHLAPDLAVEILSRSNTPEEMERKRREYFQAGASVVWLVDPDTRTVVVYTAPEQSKLLAEIDTLTGEPALAGFALPLTDLFSELDRHANP